MTLNDGKSQGVKMFKFVGFSTKDGQVKVRYANDMAARIKILISAGDTNIEFVELPNEMSREDAMNYGLQLPLVFNNVAAKEAFESTLGKKAPKVKTAKVKTAKVMKKLTPKVIISDEIDAQVDAMLQMLNKMDYKIAA